MEHPENRFSVGDFVIHNGRSIYGDGSFQHGVFRVLEDTGEFLCLESPALMFGGLWKWLLCRKEYPDWRRATATMIAVERKRWERAGVQI